MAYAQEVVVVDQTGNDFQNYWYVGTWGKQITMDDNGKVHIAYCKTFCTETDTGYQVMYANVTDGIHLPVPSQQPADPIQPGVIYIGGGKGTPVYLYYGVGSRMYAYGPDMHEQAIAKVSEDGNSIVPLGIQEDQAYYAAAHYSNPIAMVVDEVGGFVHCLFTTPSGWEVCYFNFDGTNFGEVYNLTWSYPDNDVPGRNMPGYYHVNQTKGADIAISPDGMEVTIATLHPSQQVFLHKGKAGGELWSDDWMAGMEDGSIVALFDADTTKNQSLTNIPNDDPKPYTEVQVVYDPDNNLHVVYDATYYDVYVDTSDWWGNGLIDWWTNTYWAMAGNTEAVFFDGIEHPKPQLRYWNSTMPVEVASTTNHVLIAECAYPAAGERYAWYNYNTPDSGIATWGEYLNDGPIGNIELIVNKEQQGDEPKLVCLWEEMQGEVFEFADAQWSFSNPYYAYRQDIKVAVSDDGTAWSTPYNITNSPERDETAVSAYNDVVDNKVHMMYFDDELPGRDRIVVYCDDYEQNYYLYTKHQGGSVPIRHPNLEQVNVVYREFDLTTVTGVKETPTAHPVEFSLEQNYPNPFNPSTLIKYSVPAGNVKLEIYNVLGQKIKTLVDKSVVAGSYNAIWDGTDYAQNQVSSGLYFYKLQTDAGVKMNKMLFQK